eukprot:646680-Lingulodinium_polyedra.AAC.1
MPKRLQWPGKPTKQLGLVSSAGFCIAFAQADPDVLLSLWKSPGYSQPQVVSPRQKVLQPQWHL